MTAIADRFGIYHAIDCRHRERVFVNPDARWQCSGCGETSGPRSTPKERNHDE